MHFCRSERCVVRLNLGALGVVGEFTKLLLPVVIIPLPLLLRDDDVSSFNDNDFALDDGDKSSNGDEDGSLLKEFNGSSPVDGDVSPSDDEDDSFLSELNGKSPWAGDFSKFVGGNWSLPFSFSSS